MDDGIFTHEKNQYVDEIHQRIDFFSCVKMNANNTLVAVIQTIIIIMICPAAVIIHYHWLQWMNQATFCSHLLFSTEYDGVTFLFTRSNAEVQTGVSVFKSCHRAYIITSHNLKFIGLIVLIDTDIKL